LSLLGAFYACGLAGTAEGFTLQAFDFGQHPGWLLGLMLGLVGVVSMFQSWAASRKERNNG
jgi:hypothetical protein